MQRLGLRFSFSADILTVGIICLGLSNLVLWHYKSHKPVVQTPAAAPTINIDEAIHIHQSKPQVIVKVVPVPQPPAVSSKEPIEEIGPDPVFSHQGKPTIPDSLKYPMRSSL